MLNRAQHRLMIACPQCGRQNSEYRWTLKTAARFSIGADTCPSLIMVLLTELQGQGGEFYGYRLICPCCHQGVNREELTLPPTEAIWDYARGQGEAYCTAWY